VILFLDFDGVLHDNEAGLELNMRNAASLQSLTDEQRRFITRDGRLIVGENPFGHADRLAMALEPYPDVRIVITSTWRIHFEFHPVIPDSWQWLPSHRKFNALPFAQLRPESRIAFPRGHGHTRLSSPAISAAK